MSLKIAVLCVVFAIANASVYEPTLRFAAAAPSVSYQVASAPVVSYTPAVTKTEYLPGSYSTSYRKDVITPRVKYTETPGLSLTVHQPAITVSKVEHVPVAQVAKYEHIAPAALQVAKFENIAPLSIESAPLPVARYEHIASVAPLSVAKVETPLAVTRLENIAPLPVARYETLATAPLSVAGLKTIASEPLAVSRLETFAPAHYNVAKIASVESAPHAFEQFINPIVRSGYYV